MNPKHSTIAALITLALAATACSKSKTDDANASTNPASLATDAAPGMGDPNAANAPPPGDGGGRAMIANLLAAACDGKNEGDTCNVTLHDKNLDGVCGPSRGAPDPRMMCRPKNAFFGQRPHPPGMRVPGTPQMAPGTMLPPGQPGQPGAPPPAPPPPNQQ